jgi:hypothetical protein
METPRCLSDHQVRVGQLATLEAAIKSNPLLMAGSVPALALTRR